MQTPTIEVRGITKSYGRTTAVDGLDFDVYPGKVTGFLGPNGAGKTTTMRMILGLIHPTSGSAHVLGSPYADLENPMRKVGALIEGAGYHPARSARRHLISVASSGGIDEARVDEVLAMVDLESAADRKVEGYSLGMRQRLGLATALLGDPEVLVLDEPANGLDPAGIRWIRSYLKEFAEDGRTVFVSSHALAEMTSLVDDVVMIRQGRLVAHTRIEDLVRGDAVLVRANEPTRFAEALESEGLVVERRPDGRLMIKATSPGRVGEIAGAHGVSLIELTTSTQTLEDAFLEMTESNGA